MPDVKLLPRLIERLISLTQDGKVEWSETASEDYFHAAVGQYVVTVGRLRNSQNWDAWDYQIRVSDRNGTLLDEAKDTDFETKLEIGGRTPYEALSLLYDAARRSARNVDKALTEILASLDAMTP